MIWAQCWGIPLEVWDIGSIWKIVVAVGELVEVDDDVEDFRRLDRARVLIRTPWSPFFHHTVQVTIGGEIHMVSIIEEASADARTRANRFRMAMELSEDIHSDDLDTDAEFDSVPAGHPFFCQPNNPDDEGMQSLPGDGRDNTDNTHRALLPDIPRSNGSPMGNTLQTSGLENRERPEPGKAKVPPLAPQIPAYPHAQLGKVNKDEAGKRKEAKTRGVSSEVEERAVFADKERDVEGQKDDDQHRNIGPKNISAALPRKSHIRGIEENKKLGHLNQKPAGPIPQESSRKGSMQSVIVCDIQQPPCGPTNQMGLPNQISANSKQQENNTHVIHNSSCSNECKVFVRRKVWNQKQGQQRGHQLPQGKSPTLDMASTSTGHGKQPDNNSTDKAENSKGTSENTRQVASSQWEVAKILGVINNSVHEAIINKIDEMEKRDTKEA